MTDSAHIESEINQIHLEPTRGSIAVLVLQLLVLFIGTDLLYVILNFFLMKVYFLELSLILDLHRNIILLLAALHIGKSIVQIGFLLAIVLRWVGKSYFITEKHLIKHDGVITVTEKIYDLDNVRSVTVHQSTLGKLLHYGDVVIETSASGGYMDQIVLVGVSNPERFEDRIRHRF